MALNQTRGIGVVVGVVSCVVANSLATTTTAAAAAAATPIGGVSSVGSGGASVVAHLRSEESIENGNPKSAWKFFRARFDDQFYIFLHLRNDGVAPSPLHAPGASRFALPPMFAII
jgi:hypothetical protein